MHNTFSSGVPAHYKWMFSSVIMFFSCQSPFSCVFLFRCSVFHCYYSFGSCNFYFCKKEATFCTLCFCIILCMQGEVVLALFLKPTFQNIAVYHCTLNSNIVCKNSDDANLISLLLQ